MCNAPFDNNIVSNSPAIIADKADGSAMMRAMATTDSSNFLVKPPLALIAGPTASGKSEIAVQLAEYLAAHGQRGVVINADSAQVYGDLQVLSARPGPADMRGIDHRLFGAWDGAVACSAADWAARARADIAAIHTEGAVPILVGGTGLYIRTLLDGIAPIPEIDAGLREAVRALPLPDAYAALQAEDPTRAMQLSPNDAARICRALEVVRSTGQTMHHWQQKLEGGIGGDVSLHPLILLPDRAALYHRCDARFAAMMAGGAVEEVRALLAR
ncbi:MAG: tRNA ((37)-N6)-dimethylallyltransferase MiaA, partial [Pseudomonadota bacterium]